MGLPQPEISPSSSPPSEPQLSNQTSSSSTTTKPSHPSQLPPEALALASKLFDFARNNQHAELGTYLDAGIPVNLTNHKGDTLLMLAAYHGNLETVDVLLGREGVDVDALNDRGQSIVAGAVFKGHDEVVGKLVGKGADVRLGSPSAVDTAKMFKKREMLRLFGVPEGEWEDVPGMVS